MMMVLAVPKSIAISWIKEKNPMFLYILYYHTSEPTVNVRKVR